jgi:hypothetical protein
MSISVSEKRLEAGQEAVEATHEFIPGSIFHRHLCLPVNIPLTFEVKGIGEERQRIIGDLGYVVSSQGVRKLPVLKALYVIVGWQGKVWLFVVRTSSSEREEP